jgi:hypothetical protein
MKYAESPRKAVRLTLSERDGRFNVSSVDCSPLVPVTTISGEGMRW